MKKYSVFLCIISQLFIVPMINAKTPEEGLIDALENTSAQELQHGRDVRWKLSSKHPQAGFYGSMAQPFNAALNSIQNKGIIPREKPSDSTRLHQWTYLCTHNSFSSGAHGYGPYRQQNLSMTEQLNRGVRALMLDTWLANDAIRLTHGEPKYDRWLRNLKLFQEGMKFKKELTKLKEEFFDKPENKGEVVFLILEDYISDRSLMDSTLEATGLASKILKPSEWDPNAQGGWPTFKWMKDNNKQLVIFTSKGATKYLYPQWQNMYENLYNHEFDLQEVVKERSNSKKYNNKQRYLYLLNYFKDPFAGVDDFHSGVVAGSALLGLVERLDLIYENVNGPNLEKAVNYAIINGPAIIRGRYPNFIATDFSEQAYKEGEGPFKFIDELNKKGRTNPDLYYRPIQK